MQEKQELTLKEYRKTAFRKRQVFLIICMFLEMVSVVAVGLCFYGGIDRKYLLPCFIAFCLFFTIKMFTLIAYIKEVNRFKQLNPGLKQD